jgi:alpha-beta hydrolase superfamily lysophospholipase
MTPCFAVSKIVTPKKFLLRGLWLGSRKPKRVIVWVHGLGSSMYSRMEIMERLLDRDTAVLSFNNRGHDVVAKISKQTGHKSILAGAAHEVFTDCVDDIQGAINFVRAQGLKEIYLAGHSTGCQKSIYWAHTKKGKGVKGIILLAPVSDWAAEMKLQGAKKIARAGAAARALVRAHKKHALLPESLWHEAFDAQRFLSLYTPDSAEEIFSYAQPKKNPRVLKSVHIPVLVLWGEQEEFADRPAKEVAAWFENNLQGKHQVVIVSGAGHSFHSAEDKVARCIREFMKEYCM